MVFLPHPQHPGSQVSLIPTKVVPTKLAIVGAKHLGNSLLQVLLAHPRSQVLAVVDPDRDWETALKLPGLEAVVIATPAATSYRFIQAALQNRLHVLTESLPIDPVDAIELCCLAVSQQREWVINHTHLFHPAVTQGQQMIPQLGALRYGYASRALNSVRSDVDALWELAIHDIAIFNHWLNEVPSQVQAQGKIWLQASAEPEECDRFFPGLSDLVWVKLVYPSGFQASIHLCRSTPDQQQLSVVGSQATLVFNERSQTPLTLRQGQMERHPLYPAIDPLQAVCTHFLDCIQTHSPSQISSGWLGAELVQILEALTRSLHHNGQPVTLALRQP